MYNLSKLDNGLRIVTANLPGRNSVGIGIWAKVGSRYESKQLSGVSHFLEHMLFKGTKHRSTRKIKTDVEGLGGVLNAFTGEESTCYFVKILKDYTYQAFDVLADMVNHALLDPKEHEKERTVILEEIKMYLDLPSQHVHELAGELLWPDQPLGRPIAGNLKTVAGLSPADLKSFMARNYNPRNLLISYCGEASHDEVRELVQNAFQHRKTAPKSQFVAAQLNQTEPRFYFLNKQTEQMHFVIGFHSLPKMHPDRYKLAVLNVILGANMSSRLFEEVREKRGLAYEIRSGLNFFEDTGAVSVSAGLEPKKAELAVSVIMKELKKLKTKLVSPSELKRAKDYFVGQFSLGLEDTLDHMLWVGDRAVYRDDLPNREEIFKRVRSVTSEQICDLANRIFRTNKINFALIGSYPEHFESQIKRECDCD